MQTEKLKAYWKSEEAIAQIHGWDFSHIEGRCTEGIDLPWSYEAVVRSYLRPEHRILDIDTGGGEFLLSLHHPYENTAATEGYPPNCALCRETLTPLGIDYHDADDYAALPFPDESFDVILNRHGSYQPEELCRLLKPHGLFITQQVGEDNDRELVQLLLPGTEKPFPGCNLTDQASAFRKAGFTIVRAEEAFRPIRFFDIGALIWFARIIQWEFPGFSVDTCFDRLLKAQEILDKTGSIDGTTHRYLLVVQK